MCIYYRHFTADIYYRKALKTVLLKICTLWPEEEEGVGAIPVIVVRFPALWIEGAKTRACARRSNHHARALYTFTTELFTTDIFTTPVLVVPNTTRGP